MWGWFVCHPWTDLALGPCKLLLSFATVPEGEISQERVIKTFLVYARAGSRVHWAVTECLGQKSPLLQ